jgi:hypothetical protein
LKKWLKSITTKSKRSVIRKRKKLPKYNTKPVATSDWFFDDSVCWKKSGLILNKILTDCYATRDKTEAERSGWQKGRGLGGVLPPLSDSNFFVDAEFRISLCEMRRQEIF